MSHSESRPLSRRSFIVGAGGAMLFALAGPSLAGCASSSTGGASAGSAGAAALPTFAPFTGLEPDLPADPARGINAGYLSFPTDRVRTVEGKVGAGGAFSAFVISFSPPPPPMGGNSYWQAVNKALNVELKPTLVPQEFPTKLATMLASGDIPDLVTMYLSDAQSVRRFDKVAKSQFADLSDHLSGDAVKEYPNLARFAPDAWPATYIDGRIYGTPTLRIPTDSVLYQRSDLFEAADANPAPKDAAEFEQTCKALTDPGQNRWAIAAGNTGAAGWIAQTMYPMFGVPRLWKHKDGELTKDYETPEWEEAIAYTAKLWKAGYFHPNSPTMGAAEVDPLFQNGSIAMMQDSFVRYATRGDAKFTPAIMEPFAADGGDPIAYEGALTDFVTFVKKGSKARVQESLRILNYLNAPFGSEEYFLLQYGAEGADHTMANGQPTLTELGASEVKSLSLRFIGGGPDVLYASNGNKEMVKRMHAHQGIVSPVRVTDPTAGLYSEAAASSGAINKKVYDTINDVVVGRQPVSALKAAVKSWRNEGGDKVRADYEKALDERKNPSK